MPNALSSLGGPPPAPDMPTPQSSGSTPPGGGQAPAAAPPPPSHQQTVAALRHFGAIEKELASLLADPEIGKADMKSKAIDGVTNLVSTGILTPSSAVQQLGTFPEKPFDQKKWVEQHFAQTIQAGAAILDQHRKAFKGQPAPQGAQDYNPDNHQHVMAGLARNYSGAR